MVTKRPAARSAPRKDAPRGSKAVANMRSIRARRISTGSTRVRCTNPPDRHDAAFLAGPAVLEALGWRPSDPHNQGGRDESEAVVVRRRGAMDHRFDAHELGKHRRPAP